MHILDDQTIVVVDVETTGLSAAYGDRVCEVGILRAQGDEILDTYQTLVNPQRPISPGASRVNGLRDEDVCQAPLFAEIAGEALVRIDGAALLCHNAPFDLGFLDAEFSRLGLPWGPASVIDTLEIARRYFSYSSNSLPYLAARLGIETPEAHRALGDALTTFQVFRHFHRKLAGQEWDAAGRYLPAQRRMEEAVLPPEMQEALAGNRAVVIRYIDAKGDETNRMITPLHVWVQNGMVYLVAYCHLRQAERNFRLDRIYAIDRIE
jgi:DNA polymerase III epsilon subunit family exonuclease